MHLTRSLTMDSEAKKTTLRMVPYGLYVVTAKQGDQMAGMTVNFVTQCSFTPPMIAVAMEQDSTTRLLVDECGSFAVNILEDGQRELAGQLGKKTATNPDKFNAIGWAAGKHSGAPILDESLAWLECRVTSTMVSGDHVVYLGEVVEAGIHREGQPLSMASAGFRHAG